MDREAVLVRARELRRQSDDLIRYADDVMRRVDWVHAKNQRLHVDRFPESDAQTAPERR